MPVEIYPSVAKIKRNGVYQNLPAFVSEPDDNAAQQMIATAEASNVAQYKHEVGNYFRLNDVLYETTNTINIGDNIVVGTNCKVAVLANNVSVLEKDTNNLKQSVVELKNESKTGIYIFDFCSDFSTGAINNQTGENVTTVWKYRLSTSVWFSVPKSTLVYIDPEFQISVYIKPTGGSYSGRYVDNIQSSYTFLTEYEYKITIRRITENTSVTATVAEFVPKLTYYSELKESSENIITLLDFREKYSGYKDITKELTIVDGKYVVTGAIATSANYEYVAVQVNENSRIKVTTNANSAAKVALYFSRETVSEISYIGTENITYPANYGIMPFTDYELTIPNGTSYVYINNQKMSGDLIVYKWDDGYVADVATGYKNKKILCLGDSITQLGTGTRGWIRYFNQIIQAKHIDNIAVVGAHWCDYNSSTIYDGDPQPNASEQNVIGNQVQKIINNRETFLDDYDVIIIAAGTNDTTSDGVLTNSAIDAAFFDGESIKPLANVDRSTWAGATRWVTEQLRTLFPTATIVYNTPINRINGYTSARVINNAKMVRQCAEVNSVLLCDSLQCGITMSNTTDFIDNLHPSVQGAEKLGKYNAHWFMNNIK